MNTPIPADSSEPIRSDLADFATAFHLSFYTQLAEIANNPKTQVYKIGLWTLATACCLIQLGEVTNGENGPKRSFSINLHVGISNVNAANSLCYKLTQKFTNRTYKYKHYQLESIRHLPNWIREIISNYPASFRINGFIPRESTQNDLYNILETIALEWVTLGNPAIGARGFFGNDQQNGFRKPEWKVPMPKLVKSSIRGKVTQDIAQTIEHIINPTDQFHVLADEYKETDPVSKNARRKIARQLTSISKKYYSIVNRVKNSAEELSWKGFNSESSEADKWIHLQKLLEEFIPYSVAHWILKGKHWDRYVLETGNKGIRSITITIFDTKDDIGRSIAEWQRRMVQFGWVGNNVDRDKLELAWDAMVNSDISMPWSLEIDIGSDLSTTEPDNMKLPSIFTARFSQQEVSTFKQTINVIIQILHASGFPLGDSDADSHTFGFLKLGANENGWIQGQVQRDQHYFNISQRSGF